MEDQIIQINHITQIEKKVFDYIEKHHMIVPGGKVVVGVSGGADSVCLLLLLIEYGKKIPISLAVVHVNHCLRAEAEEDARYVEELCRERKVPFYLEREDVRKLAAQEKCSEEDAGRRARYLAFYRTAEKIGGVRIAVAHNMDDNAETMLFHLFRGSGLKGLCGIAPVRDALIRPILCLKRQEVEAYLRQRGISWCTDSTNGEDHYRRNRIRHHIMPYAESEIAQGAAAHMCHTAELLSEAEDYLEQQARAAWEQCVSTVVQRQQGALEQCMDTAVQKQQGALEQCMDTAVQRQTEISEQCAGPAGSRVRYTVDVDCFRKLHIALQKRILFGIAKELSPTGKDISAVHVGDILSLFVESGNRDLNLPFGIYAGRRYGRVVLERREREKAVHQGEQTGSTGWEVQLPAQEQGYPVSIKLENEESLEFSIIYILKEYEVPRNQYTKWLDYDKIVESPVIRFRRQGDFLTIADKEGRLIHKSLKDYMIAEKIPREQRGKIPVLAAGSHVIWLVGYRISEYFKVGGNTNHILQVQLKKGYTVSETEEENVGTH